MDAIKQTVQDCVLGFRSAQDIQQQYDKVGWRMSEPEFRKFRHIAIHLSKYVGKLSEIAEQWEHAVYDDGIGESGVVIASKAEDIASAVGSLIYHSAQLSSLAGLQMSVCFLDRLTANAIRFAPESVFTKLTEMASRDDSAGG